MGEKTGSLSLFTKDNSVKTIIALAIPAVIENILQVFIGVVDTYFVGKIGTEAIAGVGITNLTMNIYIAFFLALGVGTTAIVSRNIGADNIDNANNAVKQSVIIAVLIGFGSLNLIFSKNILLLLGAKKDDVAKEFGLMSYFLATGLMIIVGAIFYIFAPFLAGLFTKDATVIDLVVKVLRIIALFQPFLCVTLVTTSALQGAGDTKFPMYSTFIGIWGIRVLGVYILGMKLELGLVGVWLAYAADITIRGIILMIRFLKGNWKKISIG